MGEFTVQSNNKSFQDLGCKSVFRHIDPAVFVRQSRTTFSTRMHQPISAFGFRPSFGFREFGIRILS